MSSTKFGLFDCPNEVLELICAFLCDHCTTNPPSDNGTANLNNLCMTSKRLCRIAQPILFHNFLSYSGLKLQILPFLRSLIDRPDLRASVREVGLCFSGLFKPPSAEDLEFLLDASTQQTIPYIETLHEQENVARSTFGIILSLTPNLVALRSSALPLLLRSPHSGSPTLPKLRKLYLDHESTDCKDMTGFLQEAPNLEMLIAYGLSCSRYSNQDYDLMLAEPTTLICLGNLRRLILPSCYVHPIVLSTMISKCGPLEQFFLSTTHMADHEYGYDRPPSLTSNTPWRALLEKRTSLRSITITGGEYPFRPSPDDDPCLLREFECLEELEMDFMVSRSLFDHWRTHGAMYQGGFLEQTLPDSIRRLTLVNAPAGLIDPVRGLALAIKGGRFPELKLLSLKPQFGETWPMKAAWTRYLPEIRSSLEGVNVALQMEDMTILEGWEHSYGSAA